MVENLKCPFCYDKKKGLNTVKDSTICKIGKNTIKINFMLVCTRCAAEWSFTELKYIKIKKFTYEKEYKETTSKKEFTDLMHKNHPEQDFRSIERRYTQMNARFKLHIKHPKNKKITPSKIIKKPTKEVIKVKKEPVKKEVIKVKKEPVKKEVIKVKKEPVVVEPVIEEVVETPYIKGEKKNPPNFPDEFKTEPPTTKLITFKDMVRMGKKFITKPHLMKHGFSQYEINWLEDEGYL